MDFSNTRPQHIVKSNNAHFVINRTNKAAPKDFARSESHHNGAAAGCENRTVPLGCL